MIPGLPWAGQHVLSRGSRLQKVVFMRPGARESIVAVRLRATNVPMPDDGENRPPGAQPLDRLDRPLNLVTQVERILREAIEEGRFRGSRLPTDAELAEQIGVSRETVRRATNALAKEGLLVKFRRKGTFLKAPEIGLPKGVEKSTLIGYVQADYRLPGGDPEPTMRYIGSLMVQGAIEAADEAGYEVVVLRATPSALSKTFERLIRTARLCGVIFASVAEERLLKRVIGLGLPAVLVDHDLHVPRVGTVRDDSAGGARLAVEKLAELGHRRIAFADWHQTDLNPWRRDGYRQALRALSLPRRRKWEIPSDLSETGARHVVEVLSEQSPHPSAIYCFNNSVGRLVVEEASRRGLAVPDELSVVGGGGEVVPGLSCHQADWYRVGREGVEILLSRGDSDEDQRPEHRLVPHCWHEGETTGPYQDRP